MVTKMLEKTSYHTRDTELEYIKHSSYNESDSYETASKNSAQPIDLMTAKHFLS